MEKLSPSSHRCAHTNRHKSFSFSYHFGSTLRGNHVKTARICTSYILIKVGRDKIDLLIVQKGEEAVTTFKKFLRKESGATAIEYALIAAGIAMAIVVILGTLGGTLSGAYQKVSDMFK